MKNSLFLLLVFSLNAYSQKPFAVVELFTSEGCSSCPPADDVLRQVKEDAEKSGQNIFTLAYHVDYWNKLGWKDPYGKFQFTIRQENYSRVIAGKEVYTPEAIINGTSAFIGSKNELMSENIKQALSKQPKCEIKMTKDSILNDTIYLSYAISKSSTEYVLRLVLTEDGLTSKVGKGENEGKTLYHDSVVRSLFSVDNPAMNGKAKIAVNVFSGKGKRHLIYFIQTKQKMEIIAASKIDLKVQ